MNNAHLTVYWGEELGRYGFGEGHPFGQDRLTAFRVAAIREGIDRSAEIAVPVARGRNQYGGSSFPGQPGRGG